MAAKTFWAFGRGLGEAEFLAQRLGLFGGEGLERFGVLLLLPDRQLRFMTHSTGGRADIRELGQLGRLCFLLLRLCGLRRGFRFFVRNGGTGPKNEVECEEAR